MSLPIHIRCEQILQDVPLVTTPVHSVKHTLSCEVHAICIPFSPWVDFQSQVNHTAMTSPELITTQIWIRITATDRFNNQVIVNKYWHWVVFLGQKGKRPQNSTQPKPYCYPQQTQWLQSQPNETSFNSFKPTQPIITCPNLSQQENFLLG